MNSAASEPILDVPLLLRRAPSFILPFALGRPQQTFYGGVDKAAPHGAWAWNTVSLDAGPTCITVLFH